MENRKFLVDGSWMREPTKRRDSERSCLLHEGSRLLKVTVSGVVPSLPAASSRAAASTVSDPLRAAATIASSILSMFSSSQGGGKC